MQAHGLTCQNIVAGPSQPNHAGMERHRRCFAAETKEKGCTGLDNYHLLVAVLTSQYGICHPLIERFGIELIVKGSTCWMAPSVGAAVNLPPYFTLKIARWFSLRRDHQHTCCSSPLSACRRGALCDLRWTAGGVRFCRPAACSVLHG